MNRVSRIALVGATLLLTACSGSESPTVKMVAGQRFEPREITIAEGDEVIFRNASEEAHTVTAYQEQRPEAGFVTFYFSSGGFDSEQEARDSLAKVLIKPGDEYRVRFDHVGRWKYFCIPHEGSGMTGTIVVE